MSKISPSPHAQRAAILILFASVLTACGAGGGSDGNGGSVSPPESAPAPSPAPAATSRWISSAAQIDLVGGADSGIDGSLMAVNPAHPDSPATPTPSLVDSTSVRIWGGKVDATLSTLDQPGPRFVVFDVAAPQGSSFSYSLYKLALDVPGTAAPVAERISTELTVCGSSGARFSVLGQSLSGDEALITYQAPGASNTCGADAVPKLLKLSMDHTATPISLPNTAQERISPIGVIHGSNGQVAAVLAWQNGRYVRVDASLGNPVPLASSDVSGAVGANSEPSSPGIVTRYGIFIKSPDGLRRYDKSTGKVSALLLQGQVDTGAQINDLHDDQALYVTTASTAGALDLYRIDDSLSPTVTKLNTDGPLHPWGFRLLKSYVIYAVDGRDDFSAWRKADGQHSNVLLNKRVVMSSTLYDRVFHTTTDAAGNSVLASSFVDGSDERTLGAAQIVSGALATQTTPFARSVRGNGAFAHAVVAIPLTGKTSLTGANVRWLSFDATALDIDAGSLPSSLDLGTTVQAPGLIAEAGMMAIPKAGTTSTYAFVSRRASGSLARINNGVQ